MLCVLPDDSSNDVTTHIHVTLLEAFCTENDINVIKVNNTHQLSLLLTDSHDLTLPPATTTDYNCLLVEFPCDGAPLSAAERAILEFCDVVSCDSPQPIITIDFSQQRSCACDQPITVLDAA
jgi:growth arrest and DNA-damage-inducible protein